MERTNLRKSNGITLIALVITIIVLLILAGVAISMLSGENGILKKAAEAKTKTEEGQKQEETALTSMELETYFQTENKKYKCSNGFITGITLGTKVSELQSALPDGYKIEKKRFYDVNSLEWEEEKLENKENINVSTGMIVEKDGEMIAKTVIFGDVDCDGKIMANDSSYVSIIANMMDSKDDDDVKELINYSTYVMYAADVNNDGYINDLDEKEIDKVVSDISDGGLGINQNRYISILK